MPAAGLRKGAALPMALLAWTVALTVAGFLAFRRYQAGMASDMRFDLETFYLPAAQAIARGETPYSVDGYVYSPLIAVVLSPLVDTPWVEETWTVSLVVAALLTCVLASLASTRGMSAPMRAGVFGLAAITLMSSWPMTVGVWMGQVDLLVALCVAAAMFAAAIGTRGLAGLSLGVAALVKTWPAALLLWLLRAPRGDSGVAEPLVASPILRVATTIVLLEWVVALRSSGCRGRATPSSRCPRSRSAYCSCSCSLSRDAPDTAR